MGRGTNRSCSHTRWRLDDWSTSQPKLVLCRRKQPPRRQSNFPPTIHFLHDQRRLDLHGRHRIHLRLGQPSVAGADQFRDCLARQIWQSARPIPRCPRIIMMLGLPRALKAKYPTDSVRAYLVSTGAAGHEGSHHGAVHKFAAAGGLRVYRAGLGHSAATHLAGCELRTQGLKSMA
jgi:hypothetical protein